LNYFLEKDLERTEIDEIKGTVPAARPPAAEAGGLAATPAG
jgi:hypothetical protein